jgi:uncharacterized protein YbjT (DUF2867 family)
MKIIISGSLGNVGRPLTKQLVTAGHDVTVISHTKERKKDIEDIGAKAARDIATAAAQLLQSDFTGKQVRYIVSDIRTPNEIASVLGAAIGNPGLHWVEFSDEQAHQGMKQGGLPEEMATLITEMNAGYRSGRLFKEFEAHGSPVNGQVKLEEFAQEFAMQFTGVPVA